jgi:hypothetical protein
MHVAIGEGCISISDERLDQHFLDIARTLSVPISSVKVESELKTLELVQANRSEGG